jgi:hypothetical protein
MSNLLIKKKSEDETLDSFVRDLEKSIGCLPWEERESSNYVEGRYFRGLSLGLEVTVAVADSNEFKNYDFWLYFEPEIDCRIDQQFLAGLSDCVARRLVISDYEVFRPLNFGRLGNGGILYRRNADAGTMPWEQIVTEKLT